MLNNRSILVTGGTGSFGKKFVETILFKYPEIERIVVYSRDELKQFEMSQQCSTEQYKQIRYFIGDVRDRERLAKAMEGIDIVIALDISTSMLAEDLKPNRLEAAKQVAQDFINGRSNDRFALVVFAGETFTQVPLTTDHSILTNMFKDVKSGMIEDGTALGDGLATAVTRLRESKAISKVIILLTDGVNNMGALDPASSAEIAKLYGIRIYTIGVGSMGMAPYPVQTPFGMQYQNMEVKIDEELLKQVAKMTDGIYFRATSNSKLKEIYHEIDKLEKSKIDVTEFHKKTEEFSILAIIAMLLFGLEILLKNTIFKTTP